MNTFQTDIAIDDEQNEAFVRLYDNVGDNVLNTKMIHRYMVKRISEIESKANFTESLLKLNDDPIKKRIMLDIRVHLVRVLQKLKEHIDSKNDDSKFSIRLFCDYPPRAYKYDVVSHLVVKNKKTSYRRLTNLSRLFAYIFFLLLLYDTLLYDILNALRFLFYLLFSYIDTKKLDSCDVYAIVLDIYTILEIPFDLFPSFITRRMELCAAGAMEVVYRNSTVVPQDFAKFTNPIQLITFDPMTIGVDSVVISDTVKSIHIVESHAAATGFLQSDVIIHMIAKEKSLILLAIVGCPDITSRSVLIYLWMKYGRERKISFTCQMDCDLFGYGFAEVLQFGSIGSAFLNAHLAVLGLKNLGSSPAHLTKSAGLKTKNLSPEHLTMSNDYVVANLIYFAYASAYVDQIIGGLFIQKKSSLGGCANFDHVVKIFLDYIGK